MQQQSTPNLPAVPGSIPFVHNVDMLVRGEDTGGRYSLMYEALPKGSGAPPHKHTAMNQYPETTKATMPQVMEWLGAYTPVPSLIGENYAAQGG